MQECKLGAVESRFAQLIWQHEPLSSTELVKLAQQELNWKKSTTYTVLKRLSQPGRCPPFSPPLPTGRSCHRRSWISCKR